MPTDTLPGLFEARLDEDPFAPAVVLIRPNGSERVWTRAGAEHRAVRIGAFCAREGLSASARVAVQATGALDAIAACWFVLATGRVLSTEARADLVLNDERLAQARNITDGYKLRNLMLPNDPALAFGDDEIVDHAALAKLVTEPRITPLLPKLTWDALRHLATGEVIEVSAEGHVKIRRAISAA